MRDDATTEPKPLVGAPAHAQTEDTNGGGQIDAKTLEEIPADVLREALGGGARRSGRKTKARVVMIDGEPVLRSNAYDMQSGEPSVFDKELGDDKDDAHGDGSWRADHVRLRGGEEAQALRPA